MPVSWQYYPKSDATPAHLDAVRKAFEAHASDISSAAHDLGSNAVLNIVRPSLEAIGFEVESGKKAAQRLKVAILFGRNGSLEKWFDADAVSRTTNTVIEVEAGRGVVNNDFLKHLFQACMMHDILYFVSVVRIRYQRGNDFETVYKFFDTLYASRRLSLPLTGVLVIGY
jgi:hypothetical protein